MELTFEIDRIEVVNNAERVRFKNSDINHRFGWGLVDGKIIIKADSCGNPSPIVRLFDSYVRAINGLHNVDVYFNPNKSVIKFDTIESANHFLKSIHEHINKHLDYSHISSYILCKKSKLTNVIEVRNNRKFKFFKVNPDFTLTKYDFRDDYEKNHKDLANDMYIYDFDKNKIVPNENNKVWVTK